MSWQETAPLQGHQGACFIRDGRWILQQHGGDWLRFQVQDDGSLGALGRRAWGVARQSPELAMRLFDEDLFAHVAPIPGPSARR
jgi:hypothetical protein